MTYPQQPQYGPPSGYQQPPAQQGYAAPAYPQYGQQQYGQPPYGQQFGPGGYAPGPKPNNYLGWSIGCIFLFWPIAIAAIIKANKVDPLWNAGQFQAAATESEGTRKLCLIATIIGPCIWLLTIILSVVVLSSAPSYYGSMG